MYPVWKPKTYNIQFNMNDVNSNNGSTEALISVDGKNTYIDSVEYNKTIKDNQSLRITMGGHYDYRTYSQITADRYGYTFTGWYYTNTNQETVIWNGKEISLLFAAPASQNEESREFSRDVVEYLMSIGLMNDETEDLTLYASYSASEVSTTFVIKNLYEDDIIRYFKQYSYIENLLDEQSSVILDNTNKTELNYPFNISTLDAIIHEI